MVPINLPGLHQSSILRHLRYVTKDLGFALEVVDPADIRRKHSNNLIRTNTKAPQRERLNLVELARKREQEVPKLIYKRLLKYLDMSQQCTSAAQVIYIDRPHSPAAFHKLFTTVSEYTRSPYVKIIAITPPEVSTPFTVELGDDLKMTFPFSLREIIISIDKAIRYQDPTEIFLDMRPTLSQVEGTVEADLQFLFEFRDFDFSFKNLETHGFYKTLRMPILSDERVLGHWEKPAEFAGCVGNAAALYHLQGKVSEECLYELIHEYQAIDKLEEVCSEYELGHIRKTLRRFFEDVIIPDLAILEGQFDSLNGSLAEEYDNYDEESIGYNKQRSGSVAVSGRGSLAEVSKKNRHSMWSTSPFVGEAKPDRRGSQKSVGRRSLKGVKEVKGGKEQKVDRKISVGSIKEAEIPVPSDFDVKVWGSGFKAYLAKHLQILSEKYDDDVELEKIVEGLQNPKKAKLNILESSNIKCLSAGELAEQTGQLQVEISAIIYVQGKGVLGLVNNNQGAIVFEDKIPVISLADYGEEFIYADLREEILYGLAGDGKPLNIDEATNKIIIRTLFSKTDVKVDKKNFAVYTVKTQPGLKIMANVTPNY